ncbi:MAG: hypothetical protein ACJ742_02220 [Actinomycetes bacterium]
MSRPRRSCGRPATAPQVQRLEAVRFRERSRPVLELARSTVPGRSA